jgi:hypothetical protein
MILARSIGIQFILICSSAAPEAATLQHQFWILPRIGRFRPDDFERHRVQ